ncbi:MAG TPA: PP2C family protein-serine/threonine phosphatase [Abditibacteriaceae bacterium]|nr:PP2C family protein-serine/threonine phosphatase [Abditibacteriaceae bacterium]
MKHAASAEASNVEGPNAVAQTATAPAGGRWTGRMRAVLSGWRMRRALNRRAPVQAPADFTVETKDAELTITAVRTVVLIVALAVPTLLGDSTGYGREEMWLAGVAGVYNIVAGLSCLLPSRFGLRRPFILAMDTMLATFWIHVSHRWDLFPFYYIVVVMAAMWFRVFGGVLAAAFCNFFFLFLWGHVAADDMLSRPMMLTAAMAINATLLFLVGCLVGFIAEAQERERQHRLESQLLIANYQREIDISSHLQPLLISPHWVEGGADKPGAFAAQPIDSTLEIGVAMKLARGSGGGDYFDLIPLEGGCTAVCIADVAGKSVRAQARIPLLKYSLRALAPLYPQPDILVQRLNETLAPDLQQELFIGLCYVVLDPHHGSLAWCNAGHIAPLLISRGASLGASLGASSGEKRAPHSPEQAPAVVALETMGPALGMFPGMPYAARSLPWCPTDQLLLFTDGLVDALDSAADLDGDAEVQRLAALLAGTGDSARLPPRAAAQQLVDAAVAALEQSSRPASLLSRLGTPGPGSDAAAAGTSAAHRDDITVVVVRYKAEETP